MPKSLADLRSKPKQLPTRVVRICLDQEAVAEVQRLESERADLLLEAKRAARNEDADSTRPPRRAGEDAEPPRVAEIAAELEALWDRMRESEGDILVRAISAGEWQRFKDEHPPREGNKSDYEVAFSLLDASALLADLGRWVESWNDEVFTAGAWDEWFKEHVSSADLAEIGRAVMHAQEDRVTVPKARSTVLSAPPRSETVSS